MLLKEETMFPECSQTPAGLGAPLGRGKFFFDESSGAYENLSSLGKPNPGNTWVRSLWVFKTFMGAI